MRTIKFRAFGKNSKEFLQDNKGYGLTLKEIQNIHEIDLWEFSQFTGLFDKNGLAEIYEGDIIDEQGLIKGNIYESPQVYKKGVDCLIEGMGTKAWRDTESVAMGFGCKYA